MAWEDLSITKPHLVYILLGAFTSLFMLCSSFIKERLYIGEATVATIFGVIFGPHCTNLINPHSWGSVDVVTIEFSRIVLVVQCFAVGVELPKFYMEKHWRSVVILLLPIMTWGWLVTSLFVWWMVPPLNWLESLVIAACVTATDPVLASSVVGKGKFARRVPKHLRDLLSAESGCNDGMAFPFLYLGVWLILEHKEAGPVTFHWFVLTILYGCIFGAFYGFMVGYISRRGIRLAEKYDLIDRESFLVFYFVLALFCAGSGSMLGLDDLLVGFAAGVGFSNDGWFSQKTEESSVSNVIDLLLNLTYFVYLGTIIPWEQFNDSAIGLSAWRLVVIAILVILFRRIPIMLMMKPFIPDIKTWREALFAGHFGPIGVGAIFVAMLARAEMEEGETVPTSELPDPGVANYNLIVLVWPIVTFLVISSIIVHGSSIAVFTLGKRINTLTLTMSYTMAQEDGPAWMNRLPRILSQSKSQARTVDSESESPEIPAGVLPPGFIRRRKSEDGNRSRASSLVPRRRKKKSVGGPISQSAIYPQRPEAAVLQIGKPRLPMEESSSTAASNTNAQPSPSPEAEPETRPPSRGSQRSNANEINVYDEGENLVFENQDGDVLAVEPINSDRDSVASRGRTRRPQVHDEEKGEPLHPTTTNESLGWSFGAIKKRVANVIQSETEKRKDKGLQERKSEPARAFQFSNTIIVENEDGEVIKTYDLPSEKTAGSGNILKYVGLGRDAGASEAGAPSSSTAPGSAPVRRKTLLQTVPEPEIDDRHIRFTIGGHGKRMTKEAFIEEMRKLDSRTRTQVVNDSTASEGIKALAKMDFAPLGPVSSAGAVAAAMQKQRTRSRSRTPTASVSSEKISPIEGHGGAVEYPSGSDSDSDFDDSGRRQNSLRAVPSADAYDVLNRRTATTSGAAGSGVGGGSGGVDAQDEDDVEETAAERRRRLAALDTIHDDDAPRGRSETVTSYYDTPTGAQTPAEPETMAEAEVEETPARRGIRFAPAATRPR